MVAASVWWGSRLGARCAGWLGCATAGYSLSRLATHSADEVDLPPSPKCVRIHIHIRICIRTRAPFIPRPDRVADTYPNQMVELGVRMFLYRWAPLSMLQADPGAPAFEQHQLEVTWGCFCGP